MEFFSLVDMGQTYTLVQISGNVVMRRTDLKSFAYLHITRRILIASMI
jgi:hypothetical protein